jgi:hypothetical protein
VGNVPRMTEQNDKTTESDVPEVPYGKQPEPAQQEGEDQRAYEGAETMAPIPDETLPDGGTNTRAPSGEAGSVEQYATGGGWYDLTPIGGQRVQGKAAAEAELARLGPTSTLS